MKDLGDRGYCVRRARRPAADGSIYLTDYEHNAIHVRDADGQNDRVLVADPRMIWPDTLSAIGGDGYLYFTANQLNRQKQYHNGKDLRKQPYAIFRFPIGSGGDGDGDGGRHRREVSARSCDDMKAHSSANVGVVGDSSQCGGVTAALLRRSRRRRDARVARDRAFATRSSSSPAGRAGWGCCSRDSSATKAPSSPSARATRRSSTRARGRAAQPRRRRRWPCSATCACKIAGRGADPHRRRDLRRRRRAGQQRRRHPGRADGGR